MSQNTDLQSGCHIGPYEIIRRAGAGGMGTVYEGRDTRLDRSVAIKASAAPFTGRLEREARAVSALNHPHICTLYDIVEQDGSAFLVMEYVKGITLAERLAKGPLPFEDAIRLGGQIAGALAAAHAKGITHRDLKPANIMLTESAVKVLDFGLAKVNAAGTAVADAATETLTAPHTLVGTLQYMAPEQLEGKECDERADIFALGLVLYEMVSGLQVFKAESSAALIAAIMRCEPEPLKAGTPQFRRTVRRCLMRDPAQRWHSAMDVKIDLEEPAAAEETPVAPPPRPKRLRAALIAAACLLFGFGVAAFWPLEPPPPVSVTPLATEFQVQTMPAWSPKGDRIAYVAAVDGVFQVFTKGVASGAPIQRTQMKTSCMSPFWSADGTRIYFLNAGVWSVPVAGGSPEKVLERAGRAAALSPDGQRLAVMNPSLSFASPPSAVPVVYEPFAKRPAAWLRLEFTPDAKYLGQLHTRQGKVWLSKVPVDGSPAIDYTAGFMDFADSFTWMPGGKQVVIAGVLRGPQRRTAPFGLVLWDLKSGRFRPISDDSTFAEFPSMSPDGRTLAYAWGRQDYDLLEVALDRSGAVRGVLETTMDESTACWNPDGTKFAYATNRTGHYEMVLRDRRDGSERTIVSETEFPGGVAEFTGCSFSPDGRHLAFNTYMRNAWQLWISNLSGEAPVPIPVRFSQAADWSPDGRFLVFFGLDQGKRVVMKMDSGGREFHIVAPAAPMGAGGPSPKWSPKGDWIVYGTEAQIQAVSPDGEKKRILSSHRWADIGWLKDGSALYGVFGDPNRRLKLGRIDFATGQETVMADLGPMPPQTGVIGHGAAGHVGLVIHPDGKTALLGVPRLNKTISMVRDFDRPVRLIDRLLHR